MYEDNPDVPPVPQEILQLDIYDALEEVAGHFTHDGVQQGNSAYANNDEGVTESHDEISQNKDEISLNGLIDVDAIDQMSAFFDEAYWTLVPFDGESEVVASSGTEIEDQRSSGDQAMDGLDLFDLDALAAFNQFDLENNVNFDAQTHLNQQVNLDGQVDVNQQIDLNHEADLNHPFDLATQLGTPIITVEGQSEQGEAIGPVTTNSPGNHLHIPSGSPYAPAKERSEHSLGPKHGTQKKKAGVRNTLTKTSEPTHNPTRSPQQYAGIRKTKSPKGKVIGAAILDHMEKVTDQPDPPARAPEQALIAQGPVNERFDITLAEFLTEESLHQIKAAAQEIAREEAKRVYSKEINSSLCKAYAQHLESKLRQQELLLQAAYPGGHVLQNQSPQMIETQPLIGHDVSFNTPGLPQPSYGSSPRGNQLNANSSPQNTFITIPNSSPPAGQPAFHMSPSNHHHAPVFQTPAMPQTNGLSFPQQNGQLTGSTFTQHSSQMNGFGTTQNALQFAQQGHQPQIHPGQQIHTLQSPQALQQQQVFYQNLQPQLQQPVQYHTALVAPQQPTYQLQSQAQAVAQQYRAQQQLNQMQQQGHQMQQAQPNQQVTRVQRGKRTKQRQSVQQAQLARESPQRQQIQLLQQTNTY